MTPLCRWFRNYPPLPKLSGVALANANRSVAIRRRVSNSWSFVTFQIFWSIP